jgi:para-nitrobenzyl esterase
MEGVHSVGAGRARRSSSLCVLSMVLFLSSAMAGPMGVAAVEGGKVKGAATDVPGVQVYKGIPFAATTAGKNRWSEPKSVEPWTGIKDCGVWGDQAFQNVNLNTVGTFWGDEFYFDPAFAPKASESGLNLNVYTPAAKASDKLPVLVYIHGGGNDHGHASEMEFYASKLAKKGIVVVTVQYRVSLFGFLALDELSKESPHGVSGNYAVLDLIKALGWVKANIAAFGGDPGSVTISGQSAGAFNVTALLRTPLAKGLFRRVIIQSGFNGLLTDGKAPVYFPLKDQEAACEQAITAAFGKKMSLAELRAIPAEEFMTRMTPDGKKSVYDAVTKAALAHGLGCTLDGYVFTEESVDLKRKGALDGIDIVIGGTSDEYTSLFGGENNTMVPEAFASNMKAAYGDGYERAYKSASDAESYRLYLRSLSDLALQKFIVSAEYAKAHDKANAYVYYFNHTPPGRDHMFYGSYHSSELWYFFDSLRDKAGQRAWTPDDYAMADSISGYMANFVKTGDPNGKGLPEWKQCSASNGAAFMRWAEKTSECVTSTPFPSRDKINRDAVMSALGIGDGDLK